ncbi:hypothetical protein IEQ34_001596 [Dendrobium chrysotoxum]|uniref:Uncharacterized protein n=1 Tax=Dendrobium chrysotoxum TaxID=161865 RepID=A0AAV7HPP0_DENCH|nr:hypothetical protein IEQ34_001596 [Dendrobium chrysotoxum]
MSPNTFRIRFGLVLKIWVIFSPWLWKIFLLIIRNANREKTSNGILDNVQVNWCVDLTLHENVDDVGAGHLKNEILNSSDVGYLAEPETLIFDVPLVLHVAIVFVSKNIGPMINMVGIHSLAPVVDNVSAHCASPLVELACSVQEAYDGINKKVAINLALMPGGDLKLITSPTVVEKDPTSGSCHDNLDVMNMGLCDVNTMVMNDSSRGLFIASGVAWLVGCPHLLSWDL